MQITALINTGYFCQACIKCRHSLVRWLPSIPPDLQLTCFSHLWYTLITNPLHSPPLSLYPLVYSRQIWTEQVRGIKQPLQCSFILLIIGRWNAWRTLLTRCVVTMETKHHNSVYFLVVATVMLVGTVINGVEIRRYWRHHRASASHTLDDPSRWYFTKHDVGVASSNIMSKPNFMKICLAVFEFYVGDCVLRVDGVIMGIEQWF